MTARTRFGAARRAQFKIRRLRQPDVVVTAIGEVYHADAGKRRLTDVRRD